MTSISCDSASLSSAISSSCCAGLEAVGLAQQVVEALLVVRRLRAERVEVLRAVRKSPSRAAPRAQPSARLGERAPGQRSITWLAACAASAWRSSAAEPRARSR
jgi:hypothetical protein